MASKNEVEATCDKSLASTSLRDKLARVQLYRSAPTSLEYDCSN